MNQAMSRLLSLNLGLFHGENIVFLVLILLNLVSAPEFILNVHVHVYFLILKKSLYFTARYFGTRLRIYDFRIK